MSTILQDLKLMNAITEANDHGVPFEEAAFKIAGSSRAYAATLDRVLDFIADGEPLEVES